MKDWFKKLPPHHRTELALEHILSRTGVGDQIAQEIESERAQRFEALRKRKAAAIAAFSKDKAAADVVVAAAEEKERAARRLADQALFDYQKARQALESVHGVLRAVTDEVDPQMRECCDPRIEEFRAELQRMLDVCDDLYRRWPDPNGTQTIGKEKYSNNRAAIDRRAHAIIQTQTVLLPNLMIDATVTDVGATLERLRNAIPEA